ncbi:hypothetical protein SASC598P14_009440 [Snodgrassella alvi SCGC AB-598-P14]|nr:hypothetical protein SASC598P14_009440 [Snodgrassella alvi SCGC AB-598-P14]
MLVCFAGFTQIYTATAVIRLPVGTEKACSCMPFCYFFAAILCKQGYSKP